MTPKLRPEQLDEALQLQAGGLSQSEIAKTLGVSVRTIGRRLAGINSCAAEELIRQVAGEKYKQYTCLQFLIHESIMAYRRSCEPAMTVKVINIPARGKKPAMEKTETTTRHQAGDPRFLETIRGCLSDQRDLLGLNAPPPKDANYEAWDVAEVVREMAATANAHKPDEDDDEPPPIPRNALDDPDDQLRHQTRHATP